MQNVPGTDRAAVPPHMRREGIDEQSSGLVSSLERDWASRRIAALSDIESAGNEAVATINGALSALLQRSSDVLRSVSETRDEMEQAARRIVDSLHRERGRLIEEIGETTRERNRVVHELADLRDRAEEDAARTRREAEEDRERVRREALGERDAIARAAQLQRDELIATAERQRDELIGTAERQRDETIAEAESYRDAIVGEAEARRDALLREVADLEDQIAEVSAQLHSLLARPSGRRTAETAAPAPARPASLALEPPAPVAAPAAVPASDATSEPSPLIDDADDADDAPVEMTASDEPRSGASDAAQAAESHLAPGASTADLDRTVITIEGVPAFARALEIQRTIQSVHGVTRVQALQFERGRLVLEVEHDRDTAILEELPAYASGELELVEQTDNAIAIRFAPA